MSVSEKKNKRNGIIGTLLFHALLLFAFLFLGLSYQDPPPPEEGISIDFGYVDEGSKEVEPEDEEEIIEIIEEKVIKKHVENTKKIITQESIDVPAVKKIEEEKIKDLEREKEKREKERINNIIEKAFEKGKKTNQDDVYKERNQGDIDGDPNANTQKNGSIGVAGNAYQLGTRKAIKKPEPIGINKEATIYVSIRVNRLGKVIFAKGGQKGTTLYDPTLIRNCEKTAKNTTFTPKEDSAEIEVGTIIYRFSY